MIAFTSIMKYRDITPHLKQGTGTLPFIKL
jgi:hypothetical protein